VMMWKAMVQRPHKMTHVMNRRARDEMCCGAVVFKVSTKPQFSKTGNQP
jgi:hypothetical protein